jgi:hypothetical protein
MRIEAGLARAALPREEGGRRCIARHVVIGLHALRLTFQGIYMSRPNPAPVLKVLKVSYANWAANHPKKAHDEKWRRELYPWPVLDQVECESKNINCTRIIVHDDVAYHVTLKSKIWKTEHKTYNYTIFVESDGINWQSRPYSDEFVLCKERDGSFRTLFHSARNGEEPLERIADAFFNRRFKQFNSKSFKQLSVSRFLAASIVRAVLTKYYEDINGVKLIDYPTARLIGGASPMLTSSKGDLWLGYRFFQEDAYEWARRSAGEDRYVLACYFAETKYQFKADLPANVKVRSITEIDSDIGGMYDEFITYLLRSLEVPRQPRPPDELLPIILGQVERPVRKVTVEDVHEANAALKRQCHSKADLRYQLAAAVVLNAWIDDEKRRGYDRGKFYAAFKPRVSELAIWATKQELSDVKVWAETTKSHKEMLFIRVDKVDFSFTEIPFARELIILGSEQFTWSGVRLKPKAAALLEWARGLRPRR